MLAIYQQRLNALGDEPIDATSQLDAFNATFPSDSKIVFRVSRVRVMYERLHGMMHYLNAYDGKDDSDWQLSLQEQRDAEEKEFSLVAKRLIVRNAMGHETVEALTLMKFEIDFYPKPRNSSLHIATMKAVFFSIVRSSNGRVTKIPDWFGPLYHYIDGEWIDRHHGDIQLSEVFIKRIALNSEGILIFCNAVSRWYQMDSPYIIKLIAASHCTSPTFIILEQAQYDLKTYLSKSEHKSKTWAKFRDIALGLKDLKEKGLVHGNIKPSNLLVGSDGIAKVSDFGGDIVSLQNLSLQHYGLSDEGKNDILKWRAPEYKSYRKRPSYQGDVYSLGSCMIDILGPERIVLANALIDQMMKDDPDERISLDEVISALDMLCQTDA